MSLSPFDSFQSRFVTYLLNFPRIRKFKAVFQNHCAGTVSDCDGYAERNVLERRLNEETKTAGEYWLDVSQRSTVQDASYNSSQT